MTAETAKRIGGRKALINQIVAIIILEFFSLVLGTMGDFANGIIFFIYVQMHPVFILFFILLLSAAYFLGKKAGIEILHHSDGWFKTGIKYTLLASLITLAYMFAAWFLMTGAHVETSWREVVFPAFLVIVTMLSVWLVSARQIMLKVTAAV